MSYLVLRGKLANLLSSKRALLQVALDFTSIDDALRIVRLLSNVDVDIFEVGTPLIKSEGVRAVSVLKREFPDAIVLADMKTIDVGALEVELAASSGADIVTVLGVANDEVIESAIEKARELGVAVEIDMIAHPDPVKRVHEIRNLNPDIIGLHIGIDVQIRKGIGAETLYDMIRNAASSFRGPIAVAGGLKPETIPPVIRSGAKIVVVGSAITKSRDPVKIARMCIEAIESA